MIRLLIRDGIAEQILAHARAEAPLECCGLLLGTPDRVEMAVAARNLRASATRFELDPLDHFRAIRQARDLGVAVVGVYHSHPSSAAVPSARDRAEATYPDFVYLIAGLPNAEVLAYRLVEGNFRPVALVPLS